MNIHPIDDMPFHQTATPFQYAATSDVHFNDGYYFGTYTDGLYVSWGMRLHPNTNVMDGWVGHAADGQQTVRRMSRALRPAYDDLRLGPLRIEILEPLQRVRAVLEPGELPMSFDFELRSQAAPFLEEPHQHRKYGHLINDVVRYSQHCHAFGEVEVAGKRHKVDGWLAVRDHSWGVRSAMGPRTWHGGVGPSVENPDLRRLRLWVHFEIGDTIGFFHTHEDEHGDVIDFEGLLQAPDGTGTRLVSMTHELEHFEGTNNFAGGTVVLTDEHGGTTELRIDLVGTPVDLQGFGYHGGWNDGGSAGVFRSAELHVEDDSYPADPALGRTGPPALDPSRRMGSIEYPCRLVTGDGREGRAHVEHNFIGPYQRYLAASRA